jgi:ssDNA-binding Zn-finger/Zn-ribbon topoisomerase 1
MSEVEWEAEDRRMRDVIRVTANGEEVVRCPRCGTEVVESAGWINDADVWCCTNPHCGDYTGRRPPRRQT